MPRAKSPKNQLRSPCPIGGALDLVGDRWTLLIVRDLFRGGQRYGEFDAAPEAIPTNILADRLVRLEECGIVTSEPYQENPRRYAYSLTARGRELKPVLVALAKWGARHVSGTRIPAEIAAAMQG